MTTVTDFIPDHRPSSRVLVLGMSPAPTHVIRSNGTLKRLKVWMDACGQHEWSFHNVIPHVRGSNRLEDVDEKALLRAVKGKKKVIALGGFVSRVCRKFKVPHHRTDHPSSRNRNFNNPAYEPIVIEKLTKYLHAD